MGGFCFYIYHMKKTLLLIFCVLIKSITASAQSDSLAMDENNKYIYYQVVTQANTPADSLYKRALVFVKKAYPAAKLKFKDEDKAGATINATGGVLVKKKSMIAMHEDASIDFKLVIEVKDNRYRFWFTDFKLVPYQRDRFANFVPVLGKDEPLETGLPKLNKKDADGYTSILLASLKSMGNKLKAYMQDVQAEPKKEIKKTTIKTREW